MHMLPPIAAYPTLTFYFLLTLVPFTEVTAGTLNELWWLSLDTLLLVCFQLKLKLASRTVDMALHILLLQFILPSIAA